MIHLKIRVVHATNEEMSRDKVFACDNAMPFAAEDYATWAGIDPVDIDPGDTASAQLVQYWLQDGEWMVVTHE
jgi:hypothetical protein